MQKGLVIIFLLFALCIISSCDFFAINDVDEQDTTNQTMYYSVRFEDHLKNENTTTFIAEGEKIEEPTEPTEGDYTFLGWYLGEEKWDFEKFVVTENIVLVAKWQAFVGYIFETFGGKSVEKVKGIKDGKITQETFRPDATFLGWCIDEECTKIIEDYPSETCTLYAKYQFKEDVSCGLAYSYEKDGVFLSGIGTCIDKEIVIPNGVVGIKNSALFDCSEVTNIVIPNSVLTIESFAFGMCSSLKDIVIPNSVTKISFAVFYGCSSLESISMPYKVKGDNGKTELFGYIFGTTKYDKSVNITQSYPAPNQNVHESFYLPETLKNVIISGGDISPNAFSGCKTLENIIISGSTLHIGISAFEHCRGLKSITISNSVVSIESYAFFGCVNLEDVKMPNSVNRIGEYAFYGCSSLNKIYFHGSSDEWNRIYIDDYNDKVLNSATIYYYSESEPTEKGNYWYYNDLGNPVEWE